MRHDEQFDKNQHEVAVFCPASVQKKIRRNLVKASVNKFNKARARRASELLDAIGNSGHEDATLLGSQPTAEEMHQINKKPTVPTARIDSKLPHRAGGIWKRCLDRISAFRRRCKR